MYRMALGLLAAAGTIGFGLGSVFGQQSPTGVDLKVLGTVDAGENCPGHILRMRRVTFAPGASIAMHDHKDHPEVSLVLEGKLSNTIKGQSQMQLPTGTPVLNGPDVVHLPANETSEPVVVLSVDLIRKP
jgi:quercetin dioxygenase-like cupin family protein